jgi:hypothetical protein
MPEVTPLQAIGNVTRLAGGDPLYKHNSSPLTLLQIIPTLHYDIRRHLIDRART